MLRDAGASVTAVPLEDTDRIGPSYADIVLPEAAQWHAPYLDTRTAGYLPAVHARIVHGRTVLAIAYLDALRWAARLRRQVDDLLEGCEAIVLPTLPIVAPAIGATDIALDPSRAALPVRTVMLRLTQLFNLTGHPAISLPVPGSGVLPVGLQVVGRRAGTLDLLNLAAGIEQALAGPPR
jgi:aspartyl-tRNA(Asn)/glutamyl-tRNA(Gln) amidotransferase subunit A